MSLSKTFLSVLVLLSVAAGPVFPDGLESSRKATPILNVIDYEPGSSVAGVGWTNEGVDDPSRREVVVFPDGNSAIKHVERVGDPMEAGANRTESDNIAMHDADFSDGQTWFYGFSIHFPEDWQFDGIQDDLVFQWKARSNPPSMFIVQKYDRLYIRINSVHTSGLRYEITDEPLELGVWHHIRMKVVWEKDDTQSGLVELDHKVEGDADYRRVLTHRGPNTYASSGYLKWGIYKPGLKDSVVDSRTIYHDNIRIGGDWESVDPSLH